MYPLEHTIKDIKTDYESGNYTTAQNRRKDYISIVKSNIEELEKQTDQLRGVRLDYLKLAGGTVSI